MGSACAACTKGSSTLNNNGEITENMSGTTISGAETSKGQNVETEFLGETQTETPQETESEAPKETIVEYELNTVESLEDDGKEMSAAEAIRSTMKGKHSALEVYQKERVFSLTEGWGWQEADEIKDMPDRGLARINMLTYNRQLDTAITPIKKAEWNKFVCVDLDQDGIKEVIVQGGPGGAALYYAGGEVYMATLNTRRFPDIVYENGICVQGSGSAWSTGYDRYYPAKGAMYNENLAYCEEGRFENGSADYYKINNRDVERDVTKEEYYAYVEELIGGLTPLEWHEFTEENIDKYVVD